MANVSMNTSASSRRHNTVGNPLIGEQPANLGNTNYLTPIKNESKLNSEISTADVTPPIDFSTLRAADFGITPESFTKQSKGQSKNAVNKFRRRSTIGIRGSPENNSLIRFIAHRQRTRKQDALVQASPFKHRNTLLKDKIAVFQSCFVTLEETEERKPLIAETSKEINARQHEQSEQASPPECERVVFEEDATQKSINGWKTSPNPFPTGTADIEKAVPGLLTSNTKSGCVILEATPSKGVSRTAHDMQFSHTGEELSQNVTSQQSYKKVRFAEKQRLEIFDETKPPITPMQRDHVSSSSARSVLKKTPIRMEVGIEHHFEHVDDSKKEEFSAGLGSICYERSPKPVDEVMAKTEDLVSAAHDASLPVDIPLHPQRRVLQSSSGSKESSPNMTPDKKSFSPPDFDHDDDQESSEVASLPERALNCDLEETTKSSLHLKAASLRITRSSAKKKNVNKAEEADLSLRSKMQIKNSKYKPNEIQKAKPAAKSQKKKPAARHKVFGKRRKRKKEQKALYGPRETISKIPFLSPIPEVTENISFVSSYQSTPESQKSIFDNSISSVLHGESVNGTGEPHGILPGDEEDGDGLPPSLDLLKRLSMSGSFSQLAGDATNVLKNMLPSDAPPQNSPEKLKTILYENEPVLKNESASSKAEMQEEPELLHLQEAGKNIKTKGAALCSVESAAQLMSESDSMSCKKFPRRSRRLSFHLPSHSETPGNISSQPEGDTEELPPAPDDSELLNSLQCCIEASFNSTFRRVRRSMRRHRDAENEGLIWIETPTNHGKGQAPLDSACNIWRRMSSGLQESELLHQKEVNKNQLPLIRSEEQENTHVPAGPRKLKRRGSIAVQSVKENDNVGLRAQRNRRASLGYKSDHCYRLKDEG